MATLKENEWTGEQAFNAWKHFGGIGGADKDAMIKIVTWLLGFSTVVITASATGKFNQNLSGILLPLIGILVSLAAGYITLMYGAYAAWNWAIADRIAEDYEWTELSPTYNPFEAKDKAKSKQKDEPSNQGDGPSQETDELSQKTDKQLQAPGERLDAKSQLSEQSKYKYKLVILRRSLITWFARPCVDTIAPVFRHFFYLSVASLLAHGYLLCYTLRTACNEGSSAAPQ